MKFTFRELVRISLLFLILGTLLFPLLSKPAIFNGGKTAAQQQQILDQGGDVAVDADTSAVTPADAQTVQTICTGDEQGTIICLQFVVGTGTSIPPSAPPSPPLINPIAVKFFPGGFQPAGVTDPNSRYGAVLFRGDESTPGFLTLLRVSVDPANPQVLQVIRQVKLKFGIGLNRFFAGRAEAVLAVSPNDPSNHGNGTIVFAVSDKTNDQITSGSSSTGYVTIIRNAWGNLTVASEQPFMSTFVGLSGPIAVAINDITSEAIVLEQTITNPSDPHFGKSPVRVFSLAPGTELRRVFIDGVGDSAAMAIDQATNHAFIARNFGVGGVAVVNLNTMTQETVASLYPGGEAQPAPGLELDLMAGKGYLAAPQLGGVKQFDLTAPFDAITFSGRCLLSSGERDRDGLARSLAVQH